PAGSFHGFGNLIGQPLAIGSTVIDQGNGFRAQVFDNEFTRSCALLGITGHHAERGVVAVVSVFGRRSHGDLRQAGIVVDAGCGDGRAGVEVAQYAIYALIHDLLRYLYSSTRVGLVITRDEFELGGFTVELNILLVSLFER